MCGGRPSPLGLGTTPAPLGPEGLGYPEPLGQVPHGNHACMLSGTTATHLTAFMASGQRARRPNATEARRAPRPASDSPRGRSRPVMNGWDSGKPPTPRAHVRRHEGRYALSRHDDEELCAPHPINSRLDQPGRGRHCALGTCILPKVLMH